MFILCDNHNNLSIELITMFFESDWRYLKNYSDNNKESSRAVTFYS